MSINNGLDSHSTIPGTLDDWIALIRSAKSDGRLSLDEIDLLVRELRSSCPHGSVAAECGLCDDDIVNEGTAAARANVRGIDCPYTFQRSAYWDAKDYRGFNAVRWKLDAWMRGWCEEIKRRRRDG